MVRRESPSSWKSVVFLGQILRLSECGVEEFKWGRQDHPTATAVHAQEVQLVRAANKYGVPIEVNTSHLAMGMTNLKISDTMIAVADQIVVNSDAHSLSDMTTRSRGFDYLRSKGLF